MRSVYGFTAASVLTSIIFSLLLFISIDDDPVMQIMFGSLAVIFELGKFFVWYEVGERLARRHYLSTLTALVFYLVLAAISIAGSVGGINSATNKAQDEARTRENQIAAYNRQIEAIDQQIALNNEAAKKYIELNRIALGLTRIQKQNTELRGQQQALAAERDSLPLQREGSVLGLIDGLAVALQLEARTAQMVLVVFLSVLLDFFAAFFISLIGEEWRFRQRYSDEKRQREADAQEPEIEPLKLLTYQGHADEERADGTDNKDADSAISDEDQPKTAGFKTDSGKPVHPMYHRVVTALENGEIRCSKKALLSAFDIRQEDAEVIFDHLLAKGRVSQKANKHFRWEG